MGELIVKSGLVQLISKYNYKLGPTMVDGKFEIDPKSMFNYPKGGIHISISPRN